MSNSSQAGQGAVSNILAVAGFIILIAIIVWGAYHFLELASSGLSSLFSRTSDAIKVTVSDNAVSSGEAFDASWTYKPDGAGVFTVLYQCQEGLQLRSVSTAGVVTAIPCGAAFPLGNEVTKTTRIIPSLTGTKTIDATLTVIFNPVVDTTSTSTTASPRPQGSVKVAIAPVSEVSQTSTTGTKTTTTSSSAETNTATKSVTPAPTKTAITNQTGKPDLEVRIIAVGVIDPYSGVFMARAPISPEETVAVKFDIANRGSAASGTWYFSAEIPSMPASPYVSPAQVSLATGAHIENTLRFTQTTIGGGIFTVTVDGGNAVKESNETNNSAAIWVTGPSAYYPYAY